MAGVIFGLLVVSLLLFFGMINFFLLSQRAGVYPPKRVLIQKAMTLGAGGAFCLLITFILYLIY
ncbi:hypothetical protein LCL95_07620 [Bacillus timonensis]|nr:hypothetical protein [Bacillus timonensis]